MRNWSLRHWLGASVIVSGLVMMTLLFIKQEMVLGLLVGVLPLVIIVLTKALNQPYWAMMLLFVENYFIMGIGRYVPIDGLGMLTDLLFAMILFSSLMREVSNRDIEWKKALNGASMLLFVWFVYCLFELINPTAIAASWVSSFRSLTLYPLLTVIFATLFFRKFNDLTRILVLWSVFTLIAVAKIQLQKTMGLDAAEHRWLLEGDNMKTHILSSGIRYFSFFTDAGNCGSNLGCAAVIFSIVGLATPQKKLKALFFTAAALGLYGMFVSGTRGAMAVPLAGFILYALLSKKTKIILSLGFTLVCVIAFFAFTTLGQSNPQIRRMRSAFDMNEPSLVVRLDNQKRLANYIKSRPFGEGIGLSGVAAKRFAPDRLTTNIPNDSWYVKVWVETGIIGLILYLTIQFSLLGYGCWLVLTKLKNPLLKAYVTALVCGIFGMMVSSYGNAIWGQYPTCILMALSQAFIFLSPTYDAELTPQIGSGHDVHSTS